MITRPFSPGLGQNQTVSTAAGSASITVRAGEHSVRITNVDATNGAFVRLGPGSASSADMFVRPNSSEVFWKGENTNISYIQSVGAVSLHIITGEGGT